MYPNNILRPDIPGPNKLYGKCINLKTSKSSFCKCSYMDPPPPHRFPRAWVDHLLRRFGNPVGLKLSE